MDKLLKYGLFVWLTVVICFAILIPQKGSFNQTIKFSSIINDTLTNDKKVKYLPLYIETDKLNKLKDSMDNVYFSYLIDTTIYPITIQDANFDLDNIVNKFQLDVAYDPISSIYLGIYSSRINEIREKTNNYYDKNSKKYFVNKALNFKLESINIIQDSTLVKLNNDTLNFKLDTINIIQDSTLANRNYDTLNYLLCNYKIKEDNYKFLIKKDILKKINSKSSLISRISFNKEKQLYLVDSLLCIQFEQVDDFNELKAKPNLLNDTSQHVVVFKKYLNVTIFCFNLKTSRNQKSNFLTVQYEPGKHYVRVQKTNYNKIMASNNFIIEAVFDNNLGILNTANIISKNPTLSFDFIPALGDRARILFFHVPTAWVSTIAFLLSLFYGTKYIRKRDILYDYKAASAAALGLMFAILATVTGAIWAKFNWGAFWNWDPRQTSIFVLILVYGAYFAFRSAIESEEQRAKLSSVYSILAGVTVPFFIFIFPRIMETLHPDPIINADGKGGMNTTMLIVFLSSLAGFTGLFAWMFNLRVRLAKLNIKENKA